MEKSVRWIKNDSILALTKEKTNIAQYHRINSFFNYLKVQSCKLYNNKYMIASIQLTNTEIFVLITVLIFKLMSRKVLFINKKTF